MEDPAGLFDNKLVGQPTWVHNIIKVANDL